MIEPRITINGKTLIGKNGVLTINEKTLNDFQNENSYFQGTVTGQMMPDLKDDEIKELETLLREAVKLLKTSSSILYKNFETSMSEEIDEFLGNLKLKVQVRRKNHE